MWPLTPSRLELTSRSKESPIARLVAVWPPVVLGTGRGQGSFRAKGPASEALSVGCQVQMCTVTSLMGLRGLGGRLTCQNGHCGQGLRVWVGHGAAAYPSPKAVGQQHH